MGLALGVLLEKPDPMFHRRKLLFFLGQVSGMGESGRFSLKILKDQYWMSVVPVKVEAFWLR
jgi:hypothetical protein